MKVLMVGYNGANNTGAEALLLADIEDVRRALGPSTQITIPSLAPENPRRYVKEGPTLRIVKVPILYFVALRKLVKEHNLVMLVEGSTYMDTWGSVLLWASLWSTRCAARFGKRCIAYAVDAGSLSRLKLAGPPDRQQDGHHRDQEQSRGGPLGGVQGQRAHPMDRGQYFHVPDQSRR